ncbi:4339_t:CDS:2 [Entrophospora sp. SA101]|nr:4339_t:CDS:2 [Entrophospora sp. SA101]
MFYKNSAFFAVHAPNEYVKTSGSGCTVSSKPTITKVKLSKESLDQFMTFLLDKNNATPSSYKVNEANGMKRIAFMTRLEIYTRNSDDSTSLNLEVLDNWSSDPIQDAWFTTSSFLWSDNVNAAKGLQGTFIANLNPSETPNPF